MMVVNVGVIGVPLSRYVKSENCSVWNKPFPQQASVTGSESWNAKDHVSPGALSVVVGVFGPHVPLPVTLSALEILGDSTSGPINKSMRIFFIVHILSKSFQRREETGPYS